MTQEEIKSEIVKLGNFWRTSQYQEAKDFAYELLENQAIQEDAESLARVYINLGIVYWNLSDYSKALEYYSKALDINEEIEYKAGIASTLGNIGNVYENLADYSKALEYHSKALHIIEEIEDKAGIAFTLGNIGNVYLYLSDYSKALEYYSKALHIKEEIEDKLGIAINLGNIGNVYQYLSDDPKSLEYYSKALHIHEEIDYKRGIATNLANIGNVYAIKESTFYDANKAEEYLYKALHIGEVIGDINLTKVVNEQLHILRLNEGRFEEALELYKKSVEIDREIKSEEIKKQSTLFDQRRKLEEDEKARQLKLARFKEQERIFHNILPISIADRLIEGEQTIAESFENVSIFFSDIVDFTTLSSNIEPEGLVQGLNTIFTAFDRIGTNYGLEKIKTIGDSYMAVCGVPESYEDHAKRAAYFALEAKEILPTLDLSEQFKHVQIRFGLHSGSVVAGIIGEKKFAYDIWGDAVNIASRMESNSEAGRIHISEKFAHSIMHHPDFSLIPRGEISIKGKGTMHTYWLERAR